MDGLEEHLINSIVDHHRGPCRTHPRELVESDGDSTGFNAVSPPQNIMPRCRPQPTAASCRENWCRHLESGTATFACTSGDAWVRDCTKPRARGLSTACSPCNHGSSGFCKVQSVQRCIQDGDGTGAGRGTSHFGAGIRPDKRRSHSGKEQEASTGCVFGWRMIAVDAINIPR